ncbi:flagellar basal body L-ring protein FlgH [Aquincola sp. MAHUQ-54]|uniref:Flagellar L-ring protein n=1 Tax=Aquincola agrisoli TaxID=3119538 RepID=A0AAW9Q6H4_9BURK
MNATALTTALAALLLSACAHIEPPQAPALAEEKPLPMLQAVARKGQSGGVFAPDAAWSLHSDSRAFRPGDVLTVVLNETTQASKSADTQFGKESNVAVSPTIFGTKTIKSNIGASASRDFNGSATSSQQNTLQGAITVIVHEVMPGGLLRVAGEKSLYLNQGEEFVRLAGYVRSADIDTDNRVSSQRIANARIAYSGRGTLADANNAGWLTRFFTSPWMPF